MQPTPELQRALNYALDSLRQTYEAPSDYALAKRLKAIGLRTSTHALWRWRNGRWDDNDLVLITAFAGTAVQNPPPGS